jgi:2-polyprenyl-3-methyl-5-hydroxy-6-metoxy-1,4-benzoquinol methylase
MSRSSITDWERETRWREEARFFDSVAARHSQRIEAIDPLVLARYGPPSPRRRFSLEYRFRLLGSLQNRDILDTGCGDGANSILLAKLGARVTGVDISPASIELARRRASINALEGSTQFICSPLETADFPPNSFDVIWCDAVLHHLISDLESLLTRFVKWARPGGLVLLAEPVNLNRLLRRIRFLVPVRTNATPDERPLERPELAIIQRYFPEWHFRHFLLFARLDRFLFLNRNYEHSPRFRRVLSDALAIVDYGLLSLPGARNLGGTAVIAGRVKK